MTGHAPGLPRPGTRRPAAGAVVALVGWTAFLAGSAAILHGVGGVLSPPPLTEPGDLARWLEQREPAEAAFAVVRLLALGLAWYLLVVTVAGTVVRAIGARSLVRVADTVTLPVVRRLVNGAVGVSFVAATLTGASGAAVADERAGPPAASASAETMRRLPDVAPADDEPPSPPASSAPAGAGRATAAGASPAPTLRRLPPAPPPKAADPTASTVTSTTATAGPPGQTSGPATSTTTTPGQAADPATGATTTTAAPSGQAGADPGTAETADVGAEAAPAMRRLSPAPPPKAAGPAPTATAAPLPTRGASPAAAPDHAARASPGAPPAPGPAPAPGDAAPSPAVRTWAVQPGDHFWAVAERVLTDAWHRAPTDDEVGPYWRALVVANAAVLRDPGNPDLLFPGQVIDIPAPAPAPSPPPGG